MRSFLFLVVDCVVRSEGMILYDEHTHKTHTHTPTPTHSNNN